MRKILLFVASAYAIIFCGCGDPYSSDYTRNQPNSQSLIGIWQLELNSPYGLSNQPTIISINADRTFVASNYPRLALLESSKGFFNATGRWSLREEEEYGWWFIEVEWKTPNPRGVDYFGKLLLLNNKPPYIIHDQIGDPDEGEALVFKRISRK